MNGRLLDTYLVVARYIGGEHPTHIVGSTVLVLQAER